MGGVERTLKFMRPIDTGRSSKQLSEMSRSICSAQQNISQAEVCNHDCAKKGAQNTQKRTRRVMSPMAEGRAVRLLCARLSSMRDVTCAISSGNLSNLHQLASSTCGRPPMSERHARERT